MDSMVAGAFTGYDTGQFPARVGRRVVPWLTRIN